MEAFYFGAPGSRLFGAYHAPSGGDVRDCGVILCYPMGREYLSAVRQYRLLATQVAGAGFPVLRFDFFACGDSQGDCSEGSVARWCEDVSTVIAELRSRHRLSRFCLAGLRLGASIAMMSGIGRADLQALVLWDPVIQGGVYLRELRLRRREAFWEMPPAKARSFCNTPEDELLGFALTERLQREISSIDLLTLEPPSVRDLLLIQTADGNADRRFRTRLEHSASRLEHHYLPEDRISGKEFRSSYGLIRSRTASLISAWVSRVCR